MAKKDETTRRDEGTTVKCGNCGAKTYVQKSQYLSSVRCSSCGKKING